MKNSRKLLFVSAVLSLLLTAGAGAWAALSILSASTEATAAQASYLQFETRLIDLGDEEADANVRLAQIPDEIDEAWRTCFEGIVDKNFNGSSSPSQDKACDDWPLLEVEKGQIERRIETIASETQTARSLSNTWQVKALEAEQSFSTTLTFGAVGVGVLVLLTVTLWFVALRKSPKTANSGEE